VAAAAAAVGEEHDALGACRYREVAGKGCLIGRNAHFAFDVIGNRVVHGGRSDFPAEVMLHRV
jgi:hypothetical protein